MISLGSVTSYDELDGQTSQDIERQLKRFFVRWYRSNGRSFPWRVSETTPFGVLIVEVLLRQTRAEMVANIWPQLIQMYPDPAALAGANESNLTSLLAPLGLVTQRVEAVKSVATAICERHNGEVPRSIGSLLKLPHIGLYSAHAVACFSFNRRVPVVDGNVLRVLSRLSGNDFGKDNRRTPDAWELAWRILPYRNAKQHNFGLLDFSAQVCTSRAPKHSMCPLKEICIHYQTHIDD